MSTRPSHARPPRHPRKEPRVSNRSTSRRCLVAVCVSAVFAVSSMEALALQGTVVTPVTFVGPVTGHSISFSVYLPPDYASSRTQYPVVYHLHGLGGFHDNRNQLSVVSQSHED